MVLKNFDELVAKVKKIWHFLYALLPNPFWKGCVIVHLETIGFGNGEECANKTRC